MAKTFIDTNVFIYANDAGAGRKRRQALDVITHHMSATTGVVSTQVCLEYASVALTKLAQPREKVELQLALMGTMEVVQVDIPIIHAGIQLKSAHSLSLWDAVILASAQAAHCEDLLTEDLAHGQIYGSVRVVNPFHVSA